MSKAVRIRDHLYEEIDRLAKIEKRSMISQLEILLEQALGMSDTLTIRDGTGTIVDHISPTKGRNLKPETADPHFRPDPK